MADKYTQGKFFLKGKPYHGPLLFYIRVIHLTHSREQQLQMISLLTFLMEYDWEGMCVYYTYYDVIMMHNECAWSYMMTYDKNCLWIGNDAEWHVNE